MIGHAASANAFAPGTLEKLNLLLESETLTEIREVIVEKAKSRDRQVYHPLLRTLRRIIMRGSGIRLSFLNKHGGVQAGQSGFPYKLEYSMVKREWYILWYSTRLHMLMPTKLGNIVDVEEKVLSTERVKMLRDKLAQLMAARQEYTVIEVIRTYNQELSRILYAFSCFEKTVSFDEASNTYRIRVTFLADESEFLLSKIRFLGKRVRIIEGDSLMRRMRESASMALGRYGVEWS